MCVCVCVRIYSDLGSYHSTGHRTTCHISDVTRTDVLPAPQVRLLLASSLGMSACGIAPPLPGPPKIRRLRPTAMCGSHAMPVPVRPWFLLQRPIDAWLLLQCPSDAWLLIIHAEEYAFRSTAMCGSSCCARSTCGPSSMQCSLDAWLVILLMQCLFDLLLPLPCPRLGPPPAAESLP